MHSQLFEKYVDDRAKIISSIFNYFTTDIYSVQNPKLNEDNTRLDFWVGEYSFFVEGRIYLTNKDIPVVIRTFEIVTQTERTLPKGENIIKAIPSLDIVINNEDVRLRSAEVAGAVYPNYIARLKDYIIEIEKTIEA